MVFVVSYPPTKWPDITNGINHRIRRSGIPGPACKSCKRDNGELMGRTECNRVVNFVGNPRVIGQLMDVTITETRSYTLRGAVLPTGSSKFLQS